MPSSLEHYRATTKVNEVNCVKTNNTKPATIGPLALFSDLVV